MAYFTEVKKLKILRFELLDRFENILHFSTTRIYADRNDFSMSFYINEKKEEITHKEILSGALKINPDSFVFCRQTHSDNIVIINTQESDKGFYYKENAISNTDGVISSVKNVCPVALSADCVPVIMHDPVKKIVASVHSGWRGTAKQVVKKAIEKMQSEFCSDPKDIICCIGPSAGPCCYEVGEDVVQEFGLVYPDHKRFFSLNINGRYMADLWMANKWLVMETGLEEKNIEIAEICTICNNELFHSARFHKGDAGRMATGIMML